ncbi:hypothetical protein BFL35_02150 [Clavibacter michiganensis]|nr:hypothetical protein BFL35_02150 [Clavibacter michiganensis]
MITHFRHRARTLRTLGIATALVVSGIAVSQASYSAFSATTSNKGNTWAGDTTITFSNNRADGWFHAPNLDKDEYVDNRIGFEYYGDTTTKKTLTLYSEGGTYMTYFSDNVYVDIFREGEPTAPLYTSTLTDLLKLRDGSNGVAIPVPAEYETDPASYFPATGGRGLVMRMYVNSAAGDQVMGSYAKDIGFHFVVADATE